MAARKHIWRFSLFLPPTTKTPVIITSMQQQILPPGNPLVALNPIVGMALLGSNDARYSSLFNATEAHNLFNRFASGLPTSEEMLLYAWNNPNVIFAFMGLFFLGMFLLMALILMCQCWQCVRTAGRAVGCLFCCPVWACLCDRCCYDGRRRQGHHHKRHWKDRLDRKKRMKELKESCMSVFVDLERMKSRSEKQRNDTVTDALEYMELALQTASEADSGNSSGSE
jgi:hypothetical protein